MGAALYAGHVSGLAVALGVGTAVFAGAGVAWADTQAPSSPSTSTTSVTGSAKSAHPKLQSIVTARDADRSKVTVSRASATAGEPTARKSPGTTVVANRVVARDPAHRSALSTPTTPPTDSPASWVLLAATRRELGPGRLTYSPEIGVVNGVITGTNQVSSTLSGARPLTYSVVGAPSGGGKVTVEAKTGNFTYLAPSSGLNPDGTQQFSQSEQFKVLIAETTPLDAALERIPLLGD